jgi:hypothetical protein
MSENLRRRPEVEVERQTPPDDPVGGDPLNGARVEIEALLQAGDEAINRALSGDSAAFLRATKQEGGQ